MPENKPSCSAAEMILKNRASGGKILLDLKKILRDYHFYIRLLEWYAEFPCKSIIKHFYFSKQSNGSAYALELPTKDFLPLSLMVALSWSYALLFLVCTSFTWRMGMLP